MSLTQAVADPERRTLIASDAVREAEAAVRARSGLKGMAAQLGLDTINRVRPGFLERHVHALLPAMAEAVDPWWSEGIDRGDAPQWLNDNALDVAESLLDVTDDHVAGAQDGAAIAVYQRLRSIAPSRIAAEMPRIGDFVNRWADAE